jgi:hypothetical protein
MSKSEKQPKAATLIFAFMGMDEFVYDQDDNLYVITKDDAGHKVIINPKSERYKGIINHRFYAEFGDVPDKSAFDSALLVKRGETTKKVFLNIRVAGEKLGTKDAVVYYDLCNSGDAVEIRPDPYGAGVKLIERPLKFKDTGKCGEQVKPNLTAKVSDATKFYEHIKIKVPDYEFEANEQQNLSEETIDLLADKKRMIECRKKILLAWTIFNLLPELRDYELVRPGIKITGSPGSAKTFNTIKILGIPDPLTDEIKSVPDDLESFQLMLYQRWIPAFDNVNQVTRVQSDKLCTAATGVSDDKRKRYTDDDMMKTSYRRSVIINGVSDVLTRPDATDRYIPIDLQRLDNKENRKPQVIMSAWRKDLPDIFGACLKILSITLYRIANEYQKPKINHRLTDFVEIGRVIVDSMETAIQIENNEKINLLPEYGTTIDLTSGVISTDCDYADEFENEFVRLMGAQEASMIDTNAVAEAVVAYIVNCPAGEFKRDGWSSQYTYKEFKDAILKDMAKNGLDKSPEYKRLENTDTVEFKREIKTFIRNFESAGVLVKLVPPAPGVKSGRNATERLKFRKNPNT